MRDDDRRPHGRFAPEGAEEAAVRRLLEEAGPRPPLAEDDVDRLAAATREALLRRLVVPAGPAASEGPVPPRPVVPTLQPTGGRGGPDAIARRRAAVWLPLAALLAVALGLGAWWALSRGAGTARVARVEAVRGTLTASGTEGAGSPLAAGAAVERGTRLCTAGGASHATLRLAGGAELRLDADTCVRAVAGERVALLRGGVYADTGAAEGRGGLVAVETPFGTVRDVGTRFAVRLLAEAVAVAVRDGVVIVGEGHRAVAGEGLVLHRDGVVERRAAPPWGPEWAWVVEAAGAFAIEGRTLADLLAWAAHESGWRLRYADRALAADAEEIVLHGDLGGLRPDEAPFVVLPGAGLEGRLEDGVLVVSRPARR